MSDNDEECVMRPLCELKSECEFNSGCELGSEYELRSECEGGSDHDILRSKRADEKKHHACKLCVMNFETSAELKLHTIEHECHTSQGNIYFKK